MVRNRKIPKASAGGWSLRCKHHRLCTDLFCDTVFRLRGRRAEVVEPYGHARTDSKRAADSRPYRDGEGSINKAVTPYGSGRSQIAKQPVYSRLFWSLRQAKTERYHI